MNSLPQQSTQLDGELTGPVEVAQYNTTSFPPPPPQQGLHAQSHFHSSTQNTAVTCSSINDIDDISAFLSIPQQPHTLSQIDQQPPFHHVTSLKRRLSLLDPTSLASLQQQLAALSRDISSSYRQCEAISIQSPTSHNCIHSITSDMVNMSPITQQERKKRKKKVPHAIVKQGYLMFHHYETNPHNLQNTRLLMREPVICILNTKKIQLFSLNCYQNQLEQQQQLLLSLTEISNSSTNNKIPICDKYSANLVGTIYLDDRICKGKVVVKWISPTCFSVYIEKNQTQESSLSNDCTEKTITNHVNTITNLNRDSCKSTFNDRLKNSTTRDEFDISMLPVDMSAPCMTTSMTTDNDNDCIMHERNTEDRLVFEAPNDAEALQWMSQIKQVAATLHNENVYIISELLLKIFEYLDEKTLLCGVSLTSRKFFDVSQHDSLWFNLYKHHYEKMSYDINYYRHMLRNILMTSSQPIASPTPNNDTSTPHSQKPEIRDDPDALYGDQVTWKYIFKKRMTYEKKHLPSLTDSSTSSQPSSSSASTTTTTASNTNSQTPSTTGTPPSSALNNNTNSSTSESSSQQQQVPSPPSQPQSTTNEQQNSAETNTENSATEQKPLTKENAERLLKEEEERKRKDEEEKKKTLSSQYLKKGNALFNAADKSSNPFVKRMLWMFCVDNYETCLMHNEKNWTAARNWCVALIRLEKLAHNLKTNDAQLYLVFLLNQCIDKFERCVKYAPKNDEVITLWAGTYSDLAIKVSDIELSDHLFRLSHEKFEEAVKIKSHIGTYNDYGISYCDWAEKRIRFLKKRVKMSTSILKTGANTYLLDSDPKSPSKTLNSGNPFSSAPLPLSSYFPNTQFSKYSTFTAPTEITLEEFEKERRIIEGYLDESSRLYDMCLNIKPDYYHALNNKGFNEKLKIDLLKVRKHSLKLTDEQIRETDIERKRLIDIACNLFQRCIEIKDFVIARNNFGNVLLQESKEESGAERFRLLKQCISQYEQAMILEPNNDGCICRCSIAYLMKAEIILAEIKSGECQVRSSFGTLEQQHAYLEHLYERAKVGFKCIKNVSLSHYNLACLNAIFNKKEECKKELFSCVDILSEQKLREDKDFDNCRKEPWFHELMETVSKRQSVPIGPTNQNLDL
ncbi:hypothetical protein C9374_005188 [Naegleria lovaniensis]|uniref:F-box domain-containing protein n=1 Tax=Naegleria lovaniensis TaxID=51637 RepID=A0AA88KK62_NAELO|nr:uncharacterized protein C9374_005188 [Naegleria lovaniensis]KAG2382608.1 hypothetical protein C9374_005188 [Naegleria lovaniensis]